MSKMIEIDRQIKNAILAYIDENIMNGKETYTRFAKRCGFRRNRLDIIRATLNTDDKINIKKLTWAKMERVIRKYLPKSLRMPVDEIHLTDKDFELNQMTKDDVIKEWQATLMDLTFCKFDTDIEKKKLILDHEIELETKNRLIKNLQNGMQNQKRIIDDLKSIINIARASLPPQSILN